MRKIRTLVVGSGFGATVVLPCLRLVDEIELAGFCARDPAKARATAARFGIGEVDADFGAILRRTAPDLVVITTPPALHARMSIEALRSGAHVLCEKPTALDAGESLLMAREASAHPEQLALIDHELRFHPGRTRLRRIVAEGVLGGIHAASVLLHAPSRRNPDAPWSWWSDAGQGGGALGAVGSHAIDALRHVLSDEVAEVRGFLATAHPRRIDPGSGAERDVTSDDIVAAALRFRSGALGTVTISLTEAVRVHRIGVAGASGAVCLDEQGPLRFEARGGTRTAEAVRWGLPHASELGIPDTDWARSFLLLARAIADALPSGRPPENAATFEDGHANQLVIDAIRRSSREDRWIRVANPE